MHKIIFLTVVYEAKDGNVSVRKTKADSTMVPRYGRVGPEMRINTTEPKRMRGAKRPRRIPYVACHQETVKIIKRATS